jgi:MFS family permease
MKKSTANFEKTQKSLYYGTDFTNGLRRTLCATLGLLYFLSLGFSLIHITTLFAVAGIFLISFEFITGPVADHFSRKLSMILAFALMGIAFLGIFLSTNFWLIAFFWVLNDIAWTFQSGANTAWIVDALGYGKNPSKLVHLFSRVYFFEKSGRVIGALIGFFVVAINFRFIWLVIALANFIMTLIIWRYMEERNFKRDRSNKNPIIKTFLKTKESFMFIFHSKNRHVLGLLIGLFMIGFSLGAFYLGVPLIYSLIHHLSASQISGLTAITSVIILAGPFMASKLSKRFGIKKSMVLSQLIIGALIFVFVLSKSLVLAIVTLSVLELLDIGSAVIWDSSLHHKIKSGIRATIGSVTSIIGTAGSDIAIALAGISIISLGIIPTMLISGVVSITTALVFWIFIKD